MVGKLLDWKLDFNHAQLNGQFEVEFNATITRWTRWALVLLVLYGVVLPVFSLGISHTSLNFDTFCSAWAVSVWCALWIPVFFLVKELKYAGILASIVFAGLCIVVTICNKIKPNNYLADPQNYHISGFMIMIPVTLRLKSRHFIFASFACVLVEVIITMLNTSYPLRTRAGYSVPNIVSFFLANYCGYFFEKKWKHDFIRRLLNDAESSKLKWAVARDSSLLRNIFPKSISDELELQLTMPKNPKKSEPKKLKSHKPMRPVLKKISALTQVSGVRGLKSHGAANSVSVFSAGSSPALSRNQSVLSVGSSGSKTELLDGKGHKLSINVPENTSDEPSHPQNGNALPSVISAPCATPRAIPAEFELSTGSSLPRVASNTTVVSQRTQPELHNVLNIQHSDGSQIALSHAYENCAVIFADLVGFTSMSSLISPQELCGLLNDLFSGFDDIMSFFRLEKVRTVGDAYLAVANMSIPVDNPEEVAVCAALRMVSLVRKMKGDLRLRVGVASGPLLAGVTGIMKWNYDIFGTPCVDAITMETLAPPNYVAVTKSVYEVCRSHPRLFFQCNRSEENKDYYLLLSSASLESIAPRAAPSAGVAEFEKSDTKIQMPQNGSIQDELMKISLAKILGANDDDEEEITAHDFQLGATHKLGYSKEDVEVQEESLRKARRLTFKNSSFEREYQLQQVKEMHTYSTYFTVSFAAVCFLFALLDIATSPSGKASEASTDCRIIFCVVGAVLFLYPLFSRYFDYYRFSFLVPTLALLGFVVSFSAVAYISPTQVHFTWCFFVFCYATMYIRVPFMLLMAVQLVLIVTSSAIIFTRATFPLRSRFVLMIVAFYLLCFLAQLLLQRNFRASYLMSKKIRYDMFHQKLVQFRTKLLLQNILPAEVIPELNSQTSNVGIVEHFEEATMMFVNFTNLEELTANLDPENTFKVYNDLFTLLDEATMAAGLEKIKTINTVYMLASGLPKKIPNHADAAVKLAIEFYKIVSNYTFPLVNKKFTIRIGIASGPVVAGIIGKTKYSYDCWSDTTNTASRMESNGWNSYLQTTPFTYNLISKKTYFQKREQVIIKGKGTMETHVLHLAKFVN